jgi:carbonic anhydrase
MKKTMFNPILSYVFLLLLVACNSGSMKGSSKNENYAYRSNQPYPHTHVLTKSDQEALTPEEVLKELKEGNDRFDQDNLTKRAHSEEIRKAATGGQYPKAMVLSCLDSRVPVEDVFDQGIGDVFVGRVAGNFVNTDLLGSMEFACKIAGAKIIVVMAHQHCGAVKGAIDRVKLGNITAMLKNLEPAIEMSENYVGEKSSKNEEYVKLVAINNVRHAIQEIRSKSEILNEMEGAGRIKIVGAFYTLRTGKMEFLD